jgi:hypothetical protein
VFGIEGTLPEGAPPQPPPVPIPMIDFSGKPVPAPRRKQEDSRMISARTGKPVGPRIVSAKSVHKGKTPSQPPSDLPYVAEHLDFRRDPALLYRIQDAGFDHGFLVKLSDSVREFHENALSRGPWARAGSARTQTTEFWALPPEGRLGRRFFDVLSNPRTAAAGAGRLYPNWYHGLVDTTCIKLYKRRDAADTRCRVTLTSFQGVAVDVRHVKFQAFNGDEEKAMICFCHPAPEDGRTLREKLQEMETELVPDRLAPDLFDHVAVSVEGEHHIYLRCIEIELNGETILLKRFNDEKLSHGEKMQLSGFIDAYRWSAVDCCDHPVIREAARHIGKSWCPDWGVWDWKPGPPHYMRDNLPWFCDEFASECIRRGTGGRVNPNPDNESVGTQRVVPYFCALPGARYLTGGRVEADISKDPLHPIWVQVAGPTPWTNLRDRVRAGFYVCMAAGEHAGLFVKWLVTGSHWNEYLGIEGSVSSRVKVVHRIVANAGCDRAADIHWDDDAEHKGDKHGFRYSCGFGDIE